jgi:hypothetical protein
VGTTDNSSEQTADQRHEEFAKENAAWDRRVRDAVSELDKLADRAKRAVASVRHTPA